MINGRGVNSTASRAGLDFLPKRRAVVAKMMTTARRIGAGNGSSSIMVRFYYQQSQQPQTTPQALCQSHLAKAKAGKKTTSVVSRNVQNKKCSKNGRVLFKLKLKTEKFTKMSSDSISDIISEALPGT